ncbi:probable sensor/response regulator hybrid [Vibrio ponticus]|nr:probable sensor/response regulator hybrid [Vibrio ponticus]
MSSKAMTNGALERKIAREKASRKQAEMLLEQKSLELYEANQQLKLVLDQLENQNLKGLQKLELEGYISASLIHFGRSFLSRTLDDGLLSSFIERIKACKLFCGVGLYLKPDLLPSVLATKFGSHTCSCPSLLEKNTKPKWRGIDYLCR